MHEDRLKIIKAEIATLKVEAIVNPCEYIDYPKGYGLAIFNIAGEELIKECKKFDVMKVTDTQVTSAYQLPAKKIIHVIKPLWLGGKKDEIELLAKCYQNVLQTAQAHDIKTLAIPPIGLDSNKFRLYTAIDTSLNEINNFLNSNTQIKEIIIACAEDYIRKAYLTQGYKLQRDFLDGLLKKSYKKNKMVVHLIELNEKSQQEIEEKNKLLTQMANESYEQNTLLEEKQNELEALTEELRQQNEVLEAKNIALESLQLAKEKLTRMIVHDFKNPLGTVLASDSLTEIRQAGKRIGDYIEDMYAIQRYGDAQLPVNKTNSSLYESAQNALGVMQGAARKKGVSIKNQIDSKHFARYDVRLIGRVLENLLSNAIKYTESGGEIVIQSSLEDATYVLVSVSDTGVGIAEDKFQEIFEPFMSLNARQFANVSATGIGLTFCKMAIEAHESEIKVSSVLGEGTRFTFLLPASALPQQADIAETSTTSDKAAETFHFEEEELAYLAPFVQQLKTVPLYKVSEIKQILKNIESPNPEIIRWKETLGFFAKNMNKVGFENLLRAVLPV